MANEEITPALAAIGFVEDPVATEHVESSTIEVNLYPTISHGEIYISLDENKEADKFALTISDAIGSKMSHESHLVNDHLLKARLAENNPFPGWIWVSVFYQNSLVRTYPMWIQ